MFCAGDDEEVGPQNARGERDVDVVGVAVGRGDEPASAIDSGRAEHVDVRGVTLDDQIALPYGVVQGLLIDVDDDERDALRDPFPRYLAPDSPEAAQHEVTAAADRG